MSRRSRSTPGRGGGGHEVRLGRDPAALLERVGPGDVVVIDRMDLDPETARELVARGVHGVINLGPSLSGRFPTEGPRLLVTSGVTLIDEVPEAAVLLHDGERVELRGGQVQRAGSVVLTGRQRSLADLGDEMAAIGAAGGGAVRLQAGLADAAALLARRPDLAAPDPDPGLAAVVQGAPTIVVGEVTAHTVDALRSSGADRGTPIVAAGPTVAQTLAGRGVKVDATVVPPDAVISISSGSGPVEVRAPGAAALLDDAVLAVVAAGASSVLVMGDDDGTWTATVDRDRGAAAATMLARVLTMGRAVPFGAAGAGAGAGAGAAASPIRSAGRRRRAGATGLRVVAIAAATALVVGGLLGWLVSGGPGAGSDLDAARDAAASADTARRAAEDELAGASAVLAKAEAALVASALEGQRLVLVVAPGVPAETVEATQRIATAAGAEWSGTITLQPKYLDADQATSLDDIAVRLAPAEAELPSSAPAGARRDAALAAAAVARGRDVAAASSGAAGLLSGLTQVGAITTSGDPTRRADRAVLLVPSLVDPSLVATPEVLVGLARALGAAGGVAVGTPTVPAPLSAVGLLRAASPPAPQVSTVDTVGRAPGRLAVVDALAAAATGTFGPFGPVAEREQATAAPTPAPTPTTSPQPTP